jgi:hypothetical protein
MEDAIGKCPADINVYAVHAALEDGTTESPRQNAASPERIRARTRASKRLALYRTYVTMRKRKNTAAVLKVKYEDDHEASESPA